MTQLTMSNVSLTRRKKEILKDIDITLTAGKVYGLVGRNGAGKSTLLSLIASYLKADEGDILLDGQRIYEQRPQMEHIAYVFESNNEIESRTVAQHFRLLRDYQVSFNISYAEALLNDYSIKPSEKINALSKGQLAAVNAITGVACMKKIVLFDEVSNGMDAHNREVFYRHILNIKDKANRIIVLSTHLVSEMDYLFDEVIIMADGEIVMKDTADELIQQGLTVTGTLNNVMHIAQGKTIVNESFIGDIRSVSLIGELSESDKDYIQRNKVYYEPIKLQDLVIYLTKPKGDKR